MSAIRRSSPRHRSTARRQRLALERLEDRTLLAVLVETFKSLNYTATGDFEGQTRADIVAVDDYHDDYSGELDFTGEVAFSSTTAGASVRGDVTGSGGGTENCPPEFQLTAAYDYDFIASTQAAIDGPQISMSLATDLFGYGNVPCTGEYTAGNTPFDNTFTGTLDISSIPYQVELTASQEGTLDDGSPYRSNTAINLEVTPVATNGGGGDIEYNIGITELTQYNGYAQFAVQVDGPTLAAPTHTTAISNVQLFFATGPNAADIIGAPIATYPLYWNSDFAVIREELPAQFPAGATHLVVIADGQNALPESSHADNVLADPLLVPGVIKTYTFTAEIVEVDGNDSQPDQAPNATVGQTITGAFSYDSTGRFGQTVLLLDGLPLHPTEFFGVQWFDNGDGTTEFAIFNEFLASEWPDFPWVYTDFHFQGSEIVDGQVPASLAGLSGEIHIGSESADGMELGFFVRANITSLTLSSTLEGLDGELTLAEETLGEFDIAQLYADASVEIDPGSVTITIAPQHGSVSVDSISGVVTYSPDPNYSGDDSFRYFAFDVQGNRTSEAEIVITVTEVPEPYQNPAGAFFVNLGDLLVTPLDAVLIINALNASGPGLLDPPAPGEEITVYFDVDGDNFLSTIDAVLIINLLNAQGQSAGEAPVSSAAPAERAAAAERAAIEERFVSEEPATDTTAGETPLQPLVDPRLFFAAMNVQALPVLPLAEDTRPASTRAAAIDALLRSKDDWWREWAA